jgi:hypothetical protein
MTTFWVIALLAWGIAIAVITSKRSEGKARKAKENEEVIAHESLSFISTLLEASGYLLTHYGTGVSLASLWSGFTKEETFSHIALMSLAQHAKDAGNNAIDLSNISLRALAIAKEINALHSAGKIRADIYKNDINAIISVTTIDSNQVEWIDRVLTSNTQSNADRIALPMPIPT